jgi:hypothetical protein
MQRNRIATFIMMFTLAAVTYESPVLAGSRATQKGPWDQAIHDNEGRLLAAHGRDKTGEPIALSSTTETSGDRFVTRTTYQKGRKSLKIQRSFEGDRGLDTIYETDTERLLISVAHDELTSESLVVYVMPDGEVFSLWITDDGDVLSGDVNGLRRALKHPMEITRLLDSYIRDKEEFKGELPSAGETFLMPLISCEDACALGCPQQCAFECLFGGISCRICYIACGIGCAIGCSG